MLASDLWGAYETYMGSIVRVDWPALKEHTLSRLRRMKLIPPRPPIHIQRGVGENCQGDILPPVTDKAVLPSLPLGPSITEFQIAFVEQVVKDWREGRQYVPDPQAAQSYQEHLINKADNLFAQLEIAFFPEKIQ